MGASNLLLTIPQGQGQTNHAVPSATAGNYQFRTTGPKGVTLGSSFFMRGPSSMVGRVGRYAEQRSVARAGSLFRSLVGPHGSPPAYYQRAVGDYTKPTTEATIMANNANTTGAIRPNSTTSEIRWIKEPTAIKRLRRHLATIGQQLVITKAGTWQRQHWGRMAIVEDTGEVYQKSVDLESRLRAFGMMADNERIEYRHDKFWLHHVARRVTVEVNGQRATYHEQLTRDFTTAKAATKAAESIKDQRELVVVSWDAENAKGGTNHGDL